MDEGPESVERITRGRTRGTWVVLALVVGLLGTVVAADVLRADGEEPPTSPTTTTALASTTTEGALGRLPLEGPTELELVVGGTLVEVDSDRRTWVGGLEDRPAGQAAGMELFQVGDDTVIVRSFSCERCGPAEVRVLVLRAGRTRSEQILAGERMDIAPGLGGLWVTRRGVDTCTLTGLDLRGVVTEPSREVPCGASVRAETDQGLLVDGRRDADGVPVPTTFLLDVDDLSVRSRARDILAVTADRALVRDSRTGFSVRGPDGTEEPMGEPGPPPDASGGAVSPDGRYAVAVDRSGGDGLWVADLVEQRWTSVPLGVPVMTVSHDWAADGRLVLFGPFVDGLGDRDLAIATWRPGDEGLAVRPVDYPPGDIVVRRSATG